MSANLFGERYLGRHIAWHKLGTVVADEVTAEEAMVRSGVAEIRYTLRPTLVDMGGMQVSTGQYAIVREPTTDDFYFRVLGTASKDYGIIQNLELARSLEKLVEKWPVETVGALGQGETVFMALDAGEVEIRGDLVRQFFLLADTKDGSTGIRLNFTPVRVVCQNTLIAGEAAAIASASLRHTKNVQGELEWRTDVIKAMQDVQERVIGDFELMALAALSDDDAESLIARSYPFPRKPAKVELAERVALQREGEAALATLMKGAEDAERRWENAKARTQERRDGAMTMLAQFNEKNPELANTAWAVYNAVVETEDWREEYGKEDADLSLLFGLRAKTKELAFAEAMAVVR